MRASTHVPDRSSRARRRLETLAARKSIPLEITLKQRLEDSLRSLARESRPRTSVIARLLLRVQLRLRSGRRVSPVFPGEIRIVFANPEQLLGRIFSFTAAADLDAFRARVDTQTDAQEAP